MTALFVELRTHHAAIQADNPRYRIAEDRWREVARRAVDDDEVLVCEIQGVVVGLARLSFTERPWGKACELHTLVVGERSRGNGVGRALMSAAEEAARAAGAKGIRLDVLVGNDEGVGFYENLGYERFAWRYGKMLNDTPAG